MLRRSSPRLTRWSCRALSIGLGIAFGACTAKLDGDGAIDTEQECEDAGGYVKSSYAGRVSCEDGEEELGTIPYGHDGAICCRPE